MTIPEAILGSVGIICITVGFLFLGGSKSKEEDEDYD